MVSRKKRQSFAKCTLSVTLLDIDQILCCILKDGDDLVFHLLELLQGISEGSFDDIVWLRDANLLEYDSRLVFNNLDKHLLFEGVECNAFSVFTSTSCTA